MLASQAIAQTAPSKPQYSVPKQLTTVVSSNRSDSEALASTQFVAPEKTPDYTTQVLDPIHAEQKRLTTNCAGEGGTLSGITCVTPPPTPSPAPVVSQVAPVSSVFSVSYPQSDDWYKQWIYNEESGNDPTKWNGSGCLGLGQACPAAKLLLVCPTESYACEDAYFTSYMEARYGSWQAAYEFHIANGWW